MKIALASVSVNDPVEAHAFYTEKLGFVSKMFMPEHHIAIVAAPDDPDGTAILLEPRGGYGSKEYFDGIYEAGLPVIVFGTDDIESDFNRLQSNGVVFTGPPTKSEQGITAVLDDTCGNFIQLHQA